MKDLFVSYEQALELKQLGFDEPCFGFYTHNGEIRRYTDFDGELNDFQTLKNSRITMGDGWCTVPTYQQVFRWFRDNHNLFGCIDLQSSNPAYWYIRVDDIIENDFVYHSEDYRIKYKTYEEAEDACLDRLIQIVKQK
jgi:hypothetical protein